VAVKVMSTGRSPSEEPAWLLLLMLLLLGVLPELGPCACPAVL
jgi:hypothetical protein